MRAIKHKSILFFLIMGFLFPFSLYGAERPPVKRVVIIDPAHGGADKGVKLSDSLFEKDVTLKIALALQQELQASGVVAVQLTRNSDREVPPAARTKIIRSAGPGILISLHVNAGFGKKAAGYEVYFPGFNAAASARESGASEIIRDMAGHKYVNESVGLAQGIMRDLQTVFPREDRGLREAPVLLLQGLSLPAVVVEIGFATNGEDKAVIAGDKGQKAVAAALSKSVRDFLGGK